MTKEEKIKEAWGEYWDFFNYNTQKRILENNGSVDYFLLSKEEKEDTEVLIGDIRKLECTKTDEGTARYFRPKSLKGIEHNEGWIKIESKEDLPKEEKDYWVVDSDGEVFICFFDTDYKAFSGYFHYDQKGKITHYQSIEKPLKPLY